MPQILKHIDKIARDKQRDVLFVNFKDPNDEFSFEYENFQHRQDLLQWLDTHKIKYEKCGTIASELGWEAYRGQVYIDLPFDETNEQYVALDKHLMTENNEFKIEGVEFYYLPLEVAMKISHHDEPGFWDKWAEDF